MPTGSTPKIWVVPCLKGNGRTAGRLHQIKADFPRNLTQYFRHSRVRPQPVHTGEVGHKAVPTLAYLENVGGAETVPTLNAQGQPGGRPSIRAGFGGLVVIRFTPQFVKPGLKPFAASISTA